MGQYGFKTINDTAISNVTATGSITPGTKIIYNGDSYMYVYNVGTTQLSPGHGCVLPATALSGATVTITNTVQGVCVGVVQHATLTTATYGWLMTRGYNAVLNCSSISAVAAGQAIGIATDGVFGINIEGVAPIGTAFTATATGGAFTGYICTPFAM